MAAKRGGTTRSRTSAKAVHLDAQVRVLALHGPDAVQQKEHLDTLREALRAEHGELDERRFDGAAASLADVFDEARTVSMLGGYKLVIVDDPGGKFVSAHRQAMERYADSPPDGATLVVMSDVWRKGNLDKKIDAVGAVVDCKPRTGAALRKWLIAEAQRQGVTLEPDAADLLIERREGDAAMLRGEIGKLGVMVEPDESVTRDMVAGAVGRSSEEQAWVVQETLLQGWLRGDMAGSLRKLHDLVELAGRAEVQVAWSVTDLVRRLQQGVLLREQGESDAAIARRLRMWGPRATMFGEALGRLDRERAAAMLARAVERDRRSKSGLGTGMRNLECLCVELADEMNRRFGGGLERRSSPPRARSATR